MFKFPLDIFESKINFVFSTTNIIIETIPDSFCHLEGFTIKARQIQKYSIYLERKKITFGIKYVYNQQN